MRNGVSGPYVSASLTVVKFAMAVPPMPMPNTPRAKPLRAGGYQPETRGTPTAKVVPPRPRKNPVTISAG